jgi:hypothetical protein
MPPVSRPVRVLWDRLLGLAPIRKDAVAYLVSAVFAALVGVADRGAYQNWALVAVGPYAIAALASELTARAGRGAAALRKARQAIFLALVVGALFAPLAVLVVLRANGQGLSHAQPEVRVIEAAGDRLAAGRDPYLANPHSVGISPPSDSKQVDSDSYFPYLPGMTPFGLLNVVGGPKELGDSRLPLVGFSLVVAALAMLLSDAPRGRKGRVLQVLVVLPTGALPMATGGDDLPVLSLMLLSLVLAQNRRPALSGLAAGASGTLKLTAWPLVLVLALAELHRGGRRALSEYALAVGVVALPVILLGFVPDPGAFVTNVIRFPLGLAKVGSPAASPLLGHLLTTFFPALKQEITVGLLGLGAVAVLLLARRFPPTAPFSAARLTGLALLLATVLAPATRFGYAIYPANLLTWAYMLWAPAREPAGEDGQSASSTWTSSSSNRLVGAV